jgi:hypothetical protein
MVYLVLSGTWFVLTLCVGLLMWATQVGPTEAVSNLSEWAVKFGIENPPEWLKAKSVDRAVRLRAAAVLAALLVIGGFMGGMAFDDYLRPALQTETKYPANRWEPLSTDESLALRNGLRALPAEKLSVLCAYAGCTDLADSIFTVVHDLNWTGHFEGGYLTDNGIEVGIAIWSYPAKAGPRNKIVQAIEQATKGRLKISSREWDQRNPDPYVANDINLVIGRVR